MKSAFEEPNLPLIPTAGIVIISLYIAAQMLSDISSLKIAMLAGFSIDAGTFIYPFTFTLRDLVHKRLGIIAARTVILLAGIINLGMAFFLAFVDWLPQDASWGMNQEFSAILGPVWRIVIASIIAELVSEFVDTEVYHLWKTRITSRHQWMRVLASNFVSIPIDSLIFCWIAFAFSLPNEVVWSIFASNIIVKGAVTIISLPSIYLVKEESLQVQSA